MTTPPAAQAQALWITGPGTAELRAAALPAPAAGQVEVTALYSAVSRGTELLVLGGQVPPDLHHQMRAPHQEGDFSFPVKYGYASVGRVTRGPADLAGRAVFCLYPHQSAYVVNAGEVAVLPDGVPPDRAVLAANLETAINGVWDAGLSLGDRVAVVGGGVVGCLCAYLCARIPGCQVELIDTDPARAAIAATLGASFALPDAAGTGRDAVLHTSGQPAGLETALRLAGPEAQVTELSWYGTRPVSLPLGHAFHPLRLTLRSSQVGELPPARRPRWSHRRRLALALSLLTDPALDVLFSGTCTLDQLPRVLPALATGGPHLCQRVRYGST